MSRLFCRSRDPESRGGRCLSGFAHGLFGLVAVIVIALVFGAVAQWAWNMTMPVLFHLPVLTFVQAVALLVLARLLTGRIHGRHHRRCGERSGRRGGWWRCGEESGARGGPPRPDGSLYAEWWWDEGESAFSAYQARRRAPQA